MGLGEDKVHMRGAEEEAARKGLEGGRQRVVVPRFFPTIHFLFNPAST